MKVLLDSDFHYIIQRLDFYVAIGRIKNRIFINCNYCNTGDNHVLEAIHTSSFNYTKVGEWANIFFYFLVFWTFVAECVPFHNDDA